MTTICALIPAHNAEATVAGAVRSALGQTRRPERIIVIDDGSSDATGAVASAAGADVMHHPEAIGPAAARNRGLRACGTQYAAFLDADDEWLPHHLENAIRAIDGRPALVASSATRVDADGLILGTTKAKLADSADALAALLLGRLRITTSATVVDVQCALATGGFDEGMKCPSCEDWDLWVRLAMIGGVRTVSTPGARYRVTDGRKDRLDTVAHDREVALGRAFEAAQPSQRFRMRARAWMELDLGMACLDAQRSSEARVRLRRSLRLQPGRPRAWALLALAYLPPAGHRTARRLKRALSGACT